MENFDDLLIKYFEREMSLPERLKFLKGVKADADAKKEFIRLRNVYALLCLMPEKNDRAKGEAAFIRFMRQRRQERARVVMYRTLAYAASVALLIGMAWMMAYRSGAASMKAPIGQTNEIQVPAGQRTKLILGDGTAVWLNARSTLTYPAFFMDDERNVRLSGEAYFEVAHDPQKPFTVSVEDVKVTALGTAFNVSGFPGAGHVQVALFEGSVKVAAPAGLETVLSPDQQAFYRNGKMEVGTILHPEQYLWKDGIYGFVNEPLASIIGKLEAYYDVSIKVTDPAISEYRYTGKFRQLDGVETILSVLQKSYPFKLEKKGSNDYILKK